MQRRWMHLNELADNAICARLIHFSLPISSFFFRKCTPMVDVQDESSTDG